MVLSRISYHYNSHVRQTRRGRTAFTPPRAPVRRTRARGSTLYSLSTHGPPPELTSSGFKTSAKSHGSVRLPTLQRTRQIVFEAAPRACGGPACSMHAQLAHLICSTSISARRGTTVRH
jgi:hypothetical protein